MEIIRVTSKNDATVKQVSTQQQQKSCQQKIRTA